MLKNLKSLKNDHKIKMLNGHLKKLLIIIMYIKISSLKIIYHCYNIAPLQKMFVRFLWE